VCATLVHTHVPLFTKLYKLVLASAGAKCTTGAVLSMLAAIRRTLRLAANRHHSSIILTLRARAAERRFQGLKWRRSDVDKRDWKTKLKAMRLLYEDKKDRYVLEERDCQQ